MALPSPMAETTGRLGRASCAPVAAACAQPRILALVETKVLSVPPKFIMESMIRPDSQSVTNMVSLYRVFWDSAPQTLHAEGGAVVEIPDDLGVHFGHAGRVVAGTYRARVGDLLQAV